VFVGVLLPAASRTAGLGAVESVVGQQRELCSRGGGQGAGRGREGFLQGEGETQARFEEEQMKCGRGHFKSGKEGRAVGAIVNL